MATKKNAAKKAVAKADKPRDPADVYGTVEYWKRRYEDETKNRLTNADRRVIALAMDGRLASLKRSQESAHCESARGVYSSAVEETLRVANKIHAALVHPDEAIVATWSGEFTWTTRDGVKFSYRGSPAAKEE